MHGIFDWMFLSCPYSRLRRLITHRVRYALTSRYFQVATNLEHSRGAYARHADPSRGRWTDLVPKRKPRSAGEFYPFYWPDGPTQLPVSWVHRIRPHFDQYQERLDQHKPNPLPICHQIGVDDDFLDVQVADWLVKTKRHTNTNLIYFLATEGERAMLSWIVELVSARDLKYVPIMAYEPISVRANTDESSGDESHLAELMRSPLTLDYDPHVLQTNLIPLDPAVYHGQVQHKALGEILSGLGQLVLHAHACPDTGTSQGIMTYALHLLAILHQNGHVPEFTYQNPVAVKSIPPPPIFHQHMNAFLSAMLDAHRNIARVPSAQLTTNSCGAQSKLEDYDFDDHHNPDRALPFAHTVWLELILWICLRGNWALSGIEIFHSMIPTGKLDRWVAKSWRQSFLKRAAVRKTIYLDTISSEVLEVYDQALVAMANYRVSESDMLFHDTLKTLLMMQRLKPLDQRHSLALVGPLARILNSCAPQGKAKLPSAWIEYLIETLRLQAEKQIKYSSSPQESHQVDLLLSMIGKNLVYHIDHSEITELNHLVTSLVQNGITLTSCDVEAASLSLRQSECANHPVIKLSIVSIEKLIRFLINIVVDEKMKVMLENLLRPIMTTKLLKNACISPTLIKYAIKRSDKNLLLQIMNDVADESLKSLEPNQKANIIMALSTAQIEADKFDQVGPDSIFTTSDPSWQIQIILALINKILKLQGRLSSCPKSEDESNLLSAVKLLDEYMFVCINHNDGPQGKKIMDTFVTVLGILASAHPRWAQFALEFFQRSGPAGHARHLYTSSINLQDGEFALLLQGVVHAYGVGVMNDILKKWCEPFGSARAKVNTKHEPHLSTYVQASDPTKKYPIMVVLAEDVRLRFSFRIRSSLILVRALLDCRYDPQSLHGQVKQECYKLCMALGLPHDEARREINCRRSLVE